MEGELWKRHIAGDPRAVDTLLDKLHYLTEQAVRKHGAGDPEQAKIIGSIAQEETWLAITAFDPDNGGRLTAYAARRIERRIQHAFERQSRTIKAPPAHEVLRKRIEALGPCSADEAARRLSTPKKQVLPQHIRAAMESGRVEASLDTPPTKDDLARNTGRRANTIAEVDGWSRYDTLIVDD